MIHLDSKRLSTEFFAQKKEPQILNSKDCNKVSETLLLFFFIINYASPKIPVER